jgi:hypothetical protein
MLHGMTWTGTRQVQVRSNELMCQRHLTRWQTALVVALFMLAARGTAFACLCASDSPGMSCGAIASAAFVFEGTVQAVGAPTFFGRGIPAIRQVPFSSVRHVRGEVTDVVFTGLDLQTLDQGPGGGRVFGRLSGQTRSNTYGPIAGATITVEGPVSRSTTTRADGSYTFQGLPYGGYSLEATAPPSLPHLARTGDSFELRPYKPCRENVLQARTSGRIQGRVVDPGSRPVRGARVELFHFRDGAQAGAFPAPSRHEQTDRDGRYQFTELPNGVYSAGVNIGQGPSVGNPFEPALARRRRGEHAFVLPLGGAVSLPPVVVSTVPRIQQPIRVRLADRRPVTRARLMVRPYGPDVHFDSDLWRSSTLIVDGDGLASLDAWQGARYVLTAGSGDRPLVRREIVAGTDLVTLVVP